MNKKILGIVIFLAVIAFLAIFALNGNNVVEIESFSLSAVNLGNDVLVQLDGDFEVNNETITNGISLKNNYSNIDIQYFPINDSKFKKLKLNSSNNLNITNSGNLIVKNESNSSINNMLVYSKTFENETNTVKTWVFEKDNYGYLITAIIHSNTSESESYNFIDNTVKNIISSLTPITIEE